MKEVTLRISFEDLFGKKINDRSREDRKERWAEWKNVLRNELNRENVLLVLEFWGTPGICASCCFCDGEWCNLQELPCSVNPILSFRVGIPGLACCGTGPHNGVPYEVAPEDEKHYRRLEAYNRSICDRNLAILGAVGDRRGKAAKAYIEQIWNKENPDNTISYSSFQRIRTAHKREGILGICGKYGKRKGKKLIKRSSQESEN